MKFRLSLAALVAVAVSVTSIHTFAADNPDVDQMGNEPLVPSVTELKVGTLHLRVGNIDTASLVDVRQIEQRQFSQRGRYVVQLDGPMTPARRATLEGMGIKLGEYLPTYAYIADLRQVNPQQLAQVDFLHWVGQYDNAWKVDPEIGARTYETPERIAMAQQGEVPIILTLFKGEQANEALIKLRELGAVVHYTDTLAGNVILSANVKQEQLGAIAELASVQYIEEASEITLRNDRVRWVVQSNQLNVTPLYDQGLRGEGQIIGVLDSRVDQNHCSFTDSAPIGPTHRKILAYNTSAGAANHGTHVAGTAVGDAGSFSNTRGVAYLARLVFNIIPSFNENAVRTSLIQHHNQGARVHTNSWGDDGTTAYNSLARGFDSFAWDYEDSLSLLAVTNQNNLRNPENAKNLLAVGATSPSPNQHQHCTGGVGPTADGRRKPEVYAPGCSTVSSTPGSCSTGSLSGTSMATPAVSAVGLLVRQYFEEGYYPTGDPQSGETLSPTGALVKAMLVNSAVDMTGVPGYPSNLEGWGRILADDTLYFIGDSRRLFVADIRNSEGLSTGQVHEEEVIVVGSGEKLKITLVWTDYPGAAGTNFAAVNDLDLEVIGPSGLYRGNVFSGGVSVTGGTKDDRNNVEQVHIANPAAGVWTIRVVGAAVNQSTQGFAIVATGDIVVEEPPLLVSLPNGAPTLVNAGEAASFDVRIAPGAENIVPGSEQLFYRMDGGSFTSVPLQFVGGDMYLATLPVATCDSTPEFYVQATGDGGTVRSSPANAPDSVYSLAVGEIVVNDVFYESFNNGLPSGWTQTGLWNVTGSCAVAGACDGTQWAYYGQPGPCNYDAGTNSGAMTSTPIAIPSVPPGGEVTLSFCYNLITETLQTYDIATFSIVGGPSVQMTDSSSWTEFTMDITEFAGESIQLRWHFDTIDGVLNNFRGWQVDAVSITAAGLECEDVIEPCPGDLNDDGVVNVSDLLILLGAWGDCSGCDADLNGDGVVNVSDLLILLGAWGDC